MPIRKSVAATVLLLPLLLWGCGTYSVRSDRSINPISPPVTSIDLPKIGAQHTVEVGESMIRKERSSTSPVLVLAERHDIDTEWLIAKARLSTMPGTYRRIGNDASGDYYEAPRGSFLVNGADGGAGGIYVPNANPAAAEIYSFNIAGKLLIYPAAGLRYEKGTRTSFVGGGFRRELVYSGISKGTITIIYREFVDDSIRPAFSQELRYDLADGKDIGYKGARFEVLNATNLSLTYKVNKSLE